jgi:lipopolysaccharide assembly protein A
MLLILLLGPRHDHLMDATDTRLDHPPEADGKDIAESLPGERRTRLSGAWTAIVVGLVALVVILVFILQNQKSVEVTFLWFNGHLPLAVALLFALVLGAVTVVAFGAARILQLRMVAGRARRR